MPRPRKCRLVAGAPRFAMYKPQGAPLRGLAASVLPVEGLEALRLVDAEGLDQEEAAARMGVSRPTLNRILGQARSVVARALANGWALRIEGGDWVLAGAGDSGAAGGREEAAGPGGQEAAPDAGADAGVLPCGRSRGRCGHGRQRGRGGR